LFPIHLNTLLLRYDAMNINYARRMQLTCERKGGWPRQARACPDRTRSIPCTVRVVTVWFRGYKGEDQGAE
jgi:hypothetical protein